MEPAGSFPSSQENVVQDMYDVNAADHVLKPGADFKSIQSKHPSWIVNENQ
jgi:hypothetical protein